MSHIAGENGAQHGLLKARDPDTVYRWLSLYDAYTRLPCDQRL